MEEYALNVLLQSVHALVYAVFVGLALKLSQASLAGLLLAFIFLNYMSKADSLFRRIFKFSDGSSLAEEISNSELSELKDNLTSASVAISVASQTDLGKKIKEGYAKVYKIPVAAGIRALSALENSTLGTNVLESLEQKRQDKENFYKDGKEAVNNLEDERKEKEEELKNNKNKDGQKLTKQEKEKLAKEIEQLKKRIAKGKEITSKNISDKQKNRYYRKKAFFERVRHTLDPDTYMEYKLDKNGNKIKGKFLKNNYKRRVVKNRKVYNAETDTYETISGIRTRFKSNEEDIWNIKDKQKALIKEMTGFAKDGVLGFGAMLVGMGTIANNPAIGLGLLASGISKTRKVTKKEDNGLKISRSIEKRINEILLENYEDWNPDIAFSSDEISEIDKIVNQYAKTDPEVGRINRILALLNSGKLKYNIPLAPFILTGTKGYVRNAVGISRKMAEEVAREVRKYKMGLYTEIQKALSKEIPASYSKTIENIAKHIEEKNIYRLMEDRRFLNNTIYIAANGVRYGFNSEQNQEVLEREDSLRQAIINTAFDREKNICITDLRKLDFNNSYTRKRLLKNLRDLGIYIDSAEMNNAKIEDLIAEIEAERLNILNDDKYLINTKVYESAVMDYMTKNKITDRDALDNENARNDIKEIYFNIINNNMVKKDAINLILSRAAEEGISLKDIDVNTVLVQNTDSLDKLKQAMAQANYTQRDTKKIIEKNISEANKLIEDILFSTLINHKYKNISEINLLDNSNADMLSIKAELLSALRLAGITIKEDQILLDIFEKKISEINNSDLEKRYIKEKISKYIEENWNGDTSKLKDTKYSDELNEYLAQKLMEASRTEQEKKDSAKVAEELNKQKSESETTPSVDELLFNANQNNEANSPDSDIPLPTVKTEVKNNMVYCSFDIPDNLNKDEYAIEVLNSSGKIISNSSNSYIITEEDKFIEARLIHNGKSYGQVLVIKYPVDVMKIVDSMKEETQQERNDKFVDRLGNRVLKTFEKLDPYSPTYLEDVNGKKQVEKAENEDIQKAFEMMEISRAVNDLEEVRKNLEKSKKRIIYGDENSIKIVEKVLDDTEALMNLRYKIDSQDEEYIEYTKNINDLMKKLLMEKMISEEQDKLKIKTESKEYKKYKKAKKSGKEELKNLEFYDIIKRVRNN